MKLVTTEQIRAALPIADAVIAAVEEQDYVIAEQLVDLREEIAQAIAEELADESRTRSG